MQVQVLLRILLKWQARIFEKRLLIYVMGKHIKYTKELLTELATSSLSVTQVVKKLGLKEAGGTHAHISRKLKEYEIDTSHFLSLGANCGRNHKGGPTKKSWEAILVNKSSGRRECAFRLRRALLEFGRPYVCEKCNQEPIWNGQELRFQVHHKDGNWLNNLPDNVAFICPNCHSQTDNFSGSKGFTEVDSVAGYYRIKRKERSHAKNMAL